MKCPKCGAEMVIDNHRRYPIHMCYYCGYMEGQNIEIDNSMRITVIQTFGRMSSDAMADFLSQCDFKGGTEADIRKWLDEPLHPYVASKRKK